jgi:type I restriction enzyme S subunit
VPENSIVLTKRAPIGLLAILGVEACSNQGCFLLVPKEDVVPGFYYYYLLSKKDYLQVLGRGSTFMELSQDDLKPLKVPYLTKEKQSNIAEFLDRETRRIDDLIKEKETQLALLSEKRQAIITQAVTKGINQKVKFKDSGINWLGEIPEHWVVKKLKYISNLKSGEFITSESIREEGLFPVYGGNGLRGYTSDKTHEGNLVLIGRQGALCGNINYASGEFWASEHAIVCNPLIDYNVTWLGELLRIMNLNQYSIAAAQPGLSVDVIKNLHIPVPSVKEQNEISIFINNETASIDKIYSVTENTIELLKERRSTIITAAVTGQLQIP